MASSRSVLASMAAAAWAATWRVPRAIVVPHLMWIGPSRWKFPLKQAKDPRVVATSQMAVSSTPPVYPPRMGICSIMMVSPTDVLHADGTYTEFDVNASKAGAAYLAAFAGMDADEFVGECRKTIRTKLCRELMEALITEDSGEPDLGRTGADLLTKAITCEHARDFGCFFKLDKPIVGIGAPSGVYIRWVGDVLGTDVIVCDDSDVGNAVGAI